MEYVRRANQRGHVNLGWLDSHHSFSFGQYHDPAHMGVSTLRVINDDTVAPGGGFATHGHQNMEIISYVLSGAVRHADSMGNEYVVPAGDVQVMSAGSGVTHSEHNHSETSEAHFLQIWIMPSEQGTAPGYQQKRFESSANVVALVTPDARDGSLSIRQDASIYRLNLDAGESLALPAVRVGYLQVIEGELTVGQHTLGPGDGLGFDANALDPATVTRAESAVHALLFDLPA